MWPADLRAHLYQVLKEAGDHRIASVEDFSELDKAPKPSGIRITTVDGIEWDIQVVTTAPPGGAAKQSSWG